MTLTKIIQKDYTSSILNYQFKLPLEMEVLIEDNDPVRLLSAFVEGLELTDLYNSYQKIKKKSGITASDVQDYPLCCHEPYLFEQGH